jgi:hypothetical protein
VLAQSQTFWICQLILCVRDDVVRNGFGGGWWIRGLTQKSMSMCPPPPTWYVTVICSATFSQNILCSDEKERDDRLYHSRASPRRNIPSRMREARSCMRTPSRTRVIAITEIELAMKKDNDDDEQPLRANSELAFSDRCLQASSSKY